MSDQVGVTAPPAVVSPEGSPVAAAPQQAAPQTTTVVSPPATAPFHLLTARERQALEANIGNRVVSTAMGTAVDEAPATPAPDASVNAAPPQDAVQAFETIDAPAVEAQPPVQQPNAPQAPPQGVPSPDVVVANLFHQDPEARAYYRAVAERYYPDLAVRTAPPTQQTAEPSPQQIEAQLFDQAARLVYSRIEAKPKVEVNEETGEYRVTGYERPEFGKEWAKQNLAEIDREFKALKIENDLKSVQQRLESQQQESRASHDAMVSQMLMAGIDKTVRGRQMLHPKTGQPVGNSSDFFNGPDGKPNPVIVDLFAQQVHSVANSPRALQEHDRITSQTPRHLLTQELARWSDRVQSEALRQTREHPHFKYQRTFLAGQRQAAPPVQAAPNGQAAPPRQAGVPGAQQAPVTTLLGPQGSATPRPGPQSGVDVLRSNVASPVQSRNGDSIDNALRGLQIVSQID